MCSWSFDGWCFISDASSTNFARFNQILGILCIFSKPLFQANRILSFAQCFHVLSVRVTNCIAAYPGYYHEGCYFAVLTKFLILPWNNSYFMPILLICHSVTFSNDFHSSLSDISVFAIAFYAIANDISFLERGTHIYVVKVHYTVVSFTLKQCESHWYVTGAGLWEKQKLVWSSM